MNRMYHVDRASLTDQRNRSVSQSVTDGGMRHGTKTGIFFYYIYHTCYFRSGTDLLYQSIYHSPGKCVAGRIERGFLFDKRNAWYSWCLPALWHFDLSEFVKYAQNCADLKLTIDILKKCVYNTIYASGIMSAALSHIVS